MSISFSTGAGLIIVGTILLLLIVPGVIELIGAFLNRPSPSVWRLSTKLAFAVSGVALIIIGLTITFKIEISETSVTPTSTIPISTFTPTSTVIVILESTITPTLVLTPTPTAWPLGYQTSTDPKPLCTITVNDFQESGIQDAKRLQFNIMGQDGYCGWIVPLNDYNATSKTSVTFWIRGEKGGEQYEVGLKDIKTLPGHEPKVSKTASPDWTQVFIPLNSFENQDLASLENFSLNFEDGSGTIYVSQLIFTP
jgi:hypothetical protein